MDVVGGTGPRSKRGLTNTLIPMVVSALALTACNGSVSRDDSAPGGGPPSGTPVGPGTPAMPNPVDVPDPNGLDQDRLFQCADPTLAATEPRLPRLSSYQFDARWPGSFGEGPPVQPDSRFRYSTNALDFRMEPEAITTLIRTAIESGTSTGFPRCIRVDQDSDTECLSEWFEGHLYRAWGRPATAEEIGVHVVFTQDAIARRGYDDGILLGGARPYVSPNFVYRFDLGGGTADGAGRRRLDTWEIANSITHALTDHAATDRPRNDSEPLEALAAAVEAGEFETPDQIETHVRALIRLPAGSDGMPRLPSPVTRFFREFLGYPDAIHVFKSGGRTNRRGYAAHVFEPQLDGMIQGVVRSNSDVLRTLLTSNQYWFGEQDGRFPDRNYPFNLEGQTLSQWVELPADQRAGILTHPGWLVTHSGNQHTDPHPVHRGKWIRENLLCDTVPGGTDWRRRNDPRRPDRLGPSAPCRDHPGGRFLLGLPPDDGPARSAVRGLRSLRALPHRRVRWRGRRLGPE